MFEFLHHIKYAGAVVVRRLMDALQTPTASHQMHMLKETDASCANRLRAEKYAATLNRKVWVNDRPQIYKETTAQAPAQQQQQQQPPLA